MEDRRTSRSRPKSGPFRKGRNGTGSPKGNVADPRAGKRPRSGRKRSDLERSKLPPARPGHRKSGRKKWAETSADPIVSDLQITDGRLRARHIRNIDKVNDSITPRKVREALFRLIIRRVRAARVLDLCAGCGVVGMEALSRGAMLCTFVERSTRAAGCLSDNLQACGIRGGHFELVTMEALPFLRRMRKRRRFWDVVYCAFPAGIVPDDYFKAFGNGVPVRPRGILIIEHPSDMETPASLGLLRRWRHFSKDAVALSIYERAK